MIFNVLTLFKNSRPSETLAVNVNIQRLMKSQGEELGNHFLLSKISSSLNSIQTIISIAFVNLIYFFLLQLTKLSKILIPRNI